MVLGSDSGEKPSLPGTPDGWVGKEKGETGGGGGAVVREIPGGGLGGELTKQSLAMKRNLKKR